MLTQDQVNNIVVEAKAAAKKAAELFKRDVLGGVDQMPCGFAWTYIAEYDGKKVKGNMKIGKMLKEAGVKQGYNGVFEIWGPGDYRGQNVDAHQAGAFAAAEVFNNYGFSANAGSRWD